MGTGAVQRTEDYKCHQDERQEHRNDHGGDRCPGPFVRDCHGGCLYCQGNGCGCGHLHHLLSGLYTLYRSFFNRLRYCLFAKLLVKLPL